MRKLLVVLGVLVMVGCSDDEGEIGPYSIGGWHDLICLSKTRTVRHGDGRVETTTFEQVNTTISGSNAGVSRVSVWLCDREDFGPVAADCPAGATCSGDTPEQPNCVIAKGALLGARLLVNCGAKTVTTSAGATTESGYMYRTVGYTVD